MIPGQRFRLRKGLVKTVGSAETSIGGLTGTLVELSHDFVIFRFDEPVPGLEDWDNEAIWSDNDVDPDEYPDDRPGQRACMRALFESLVAERLD